MTPTPSFQSYKRFRPDGAYDAIVVGSGIGGLGTAALLAKQAGRRVLVLERHYTAGGYTHAFRRPGYEWDVGVHYIGSVEPGTTVRALFDYVTDGALGWADMGEVYDRIVIGQDIYDYPRGLANLKARLKAYFPGDEAAIDGYFTAVRAAVAGSQLFFADRAMPALVSAVAGPLLRRRFLKYADRTTRQVLDSMIRIVGRDQVWQGHGGRLAWSVAPLFSGGRFTFRYRAVQHINKVLAFLARSGHWQAITHRLFRSRLATARYDAIISRMLADMSICRNSTVIPWQTGQVNVSFFCSGGITWGLNNPNHMTSGWPWALFHRLQSSVQSHSAWLRGP